MISIELSPDIEKQFSEVVRDSYGGNSQTAIVTLLKLHRKYGWKEQLTQAESVPVSKPKYTSDTLASEPDITQTRTWELCGSLEIEKPDLRYVVARDLQGRIITDYAEHTDEVLTEDTHV
jgi:hypothetical protein